MHSKTLTALKQSIKKWERIIKKTGADKGIDNCFLCQLFYINNSCIGCPVAEKSKIIKCKRTPYTKWDRHQKKTHYNETIIECKTCEKFAKQELKFLISLLPKR